MRTICSRLPDAAERLRALLLERHDQPFAWGFRDCALWAADAVFATTGRDPAGNFRGAYFSARGALRLIRARGGLEAIVDAQLGPRMKPHAALDGDVALLPEGELGSLAIVWRGALIAQGERGLVVRRVGEASIFWGAR